MDLQNQQQAVLPRNLSPRRRHSVSDLAIKSHQANFRNLNKFANRTYMFFSSEESKFMHFNLIIFKYFFEFILRDFSLPKRALQKKEFAPPMEKSRSEGFFKKKSLPSIEEIMTKHKTVRRKPREKKTPATKEAKALSGVGVVTETKFS